MAKNSTELPKTAIVSEKSFNFSETILIGFYYEENISLGGWAYDMVYKELPLEVITAGQYR